MPFILKRFADREDLSPFERIHFSLDDRVEQNERARALYRMLYRNMHPAASTVLLLLCLICALPVVLALLVVGALWESLTQWWGADDESHFGGLCAFVCFLIAEYWALIAEHAWCWLLVPAAIIALIAFWFGLLMNDYEQELARAEAKLLHAST